MINLEQWEVMGTLRHPFISTLMSVLVAFASLRRFSVVRNYRLITIRPGNWFTIDTLQGSSQVLQFIQKGFKLC